MAALSPDDPAFVAIVEDDRPIAQRRKRRNSSTSSLIMRPDGQVAHHQEPDNSSSPVLAHESSNGLNTPPQTPHRTKKRVRFSDPNNIADAGQTPPSSRRSGLTPFIQRASILSTPSSSSSSRRRSRPSLLSSPVSASSSRSSTSSPGRRNVNDIPKSGTIQFQPLRQILSERVIRRIRRNGISEEMLVIEAEKAAGKKNQKLEIESLRTKLQNKEEELANMMIELENARQLGRETGPTIARAEELQIEKANLSAELNLSEKEFDRNEPEWTLAAKDPYEENDLMAAEGVDQEDDFMPDFSASQVFVSTPSRSRNETRFDDKNISSVSSTSHDIQEIDLMDMRLKAPVVDQEKAHLKAEMIRLKESFVTLYARISTKLTPFTSNSFASSTNGIDIDKFDPEDLSSLDTILDTILTELAVAKSSAREQSQIVEVFSTEIKMLSSDPNTPADEILQTLKEEFKAARLELERLIPGETPEGFSPPAAILRVLIEKLSHFVDRVTQQDADIDAYHEQEVSLRKQLGSRIDVNDALQKSLKGTLERVLDMEHDIEDRDASIAKLTNALDTYRIEVSSLEALITRLEDSQSTEISELDASHARAFETQAKIHSETLTTALNEKLSIEAAQERSMTFLKELEARLNTAHAKSAALETDLTKTTKERDRAVSMIGKLNTAHGSALALRDARVTELRSELDRVNISLRDAHATILRLRNEKTRMSREMEVLEGENQEMANATKKFEDERVRHEANSSALEQEKADLRSEYESSKSTWEQEKNELETRLAKSDHHLQYIVGVASGNLKTGSTPQKPMSGGGNGADTSNGGNSSDVVAVPVPKMPLLDARRARRGSGSASGKKRRRCDSGLGFVDEGGDETDVFMS